MKKILAALALAMTLTISACNTAEVKVSTKYTDPNTGAVILVVYEDGEASGYIEYVDAESGLITRIKYEKDEVTGNITYLSPETGLETTIEIGDEGWDSLQQFLVSFS